MKYRWFDSQGTERLQQYLIPGKSFAVGVGEALAADFTLTTTAGFWMDAHTSRARGETPDNYPQFSFRYLTDADTGAHEEHTITLSGEALEPDPHQNGRWAHRLEQEINGETSPFAAFVEPIRRLYFISRVRNEPLPELSWKEISELPLPLKEPKGARGTDPLQLRSDVRQRPRPQARPNLGWRQPRIGRLLLAATSWRPFRTIVPVSQLMAFAQAVVPDQADFSRREEFV
ncbi:hypothetical protein AHiyo4_27210 [Arthrobacter sp. Hiyo4]|nr:hypothetical protein AHiyo4_27210 [Arthrobacter sp. Hiyo4]